MELRLSVDKNNEAERLVLVSVIGLLEALENDLLTIEDCENYLFSPYSVSILEEKNMNPQIIEIIELGCELEDVQSLIPDKLKEEIRDLKERAKEYLKNTNPSENPYEVKKWVDR
ncbi:DUF3969 family protein [Enterococcus plantarum]|uniref:DUF3969 domain-containing protein n=1 Tax=Enterococcus plantarum TaxID=1077675 RepID=A0A2W3Z9E6_9ENTE|nr:DUF3969 family protein [Enterococcus plantarum]MBO0424078.1 DUF3969 family protein [Enterococcus plantarum]PZL73087.1 DUF3969 domain-containing protein [Enterococcus plantarum]